MTRCSVTGNPCTYCMGGPCGSREENDASGNKPQRDTEVLGAAIERYGADNQILQTVEEMAELTHAIMRYRRAQADFSDGKINSEEFTPYLDALLEEKADVEIMLDQLTIIFAPVDAWRRAKLWRLAERLNEGKNKAEGGG